MDSMKLHSGHRERMRKRFLSAKQDTLFDHELLELLLFYARPVINTNSIAHSLIDEIGSLGNVMAADTEKLKKIHGIGDKGAAFIHFMLDMGRNYLRSSHTNETLATKEHLYSCFEELSSEQSKGICTLLCLSQSSELLRTVTIPQNDVLDGKITAREAAMIILSSRAVSVCVGISHGSSAVPCSQDYITARFFGETLSAIGVTFTDCMITGGEKCFSMRENGAFAF